MSDAPATPVASAPARPGRVSVPDLPDALIDRNQHWILRVEALDGMLRARLPGRALPEEELDRVRADAPPPLRQAIDRALLEERRYEARCRAAEAGPSARAAHLDPSLTSRLWAGTARERASNLLDLARGERFDAGPALAGLLLEERDPGVLAAAVRTVGRVGSRALVPSLAHLLGTDGGPVAEDVMAALGWIRDEASTHLLLRGLGSDSASVRREAAAALWTLPRREVRAGLTKGVRPLGGSLDTGIREYLAPLPLRSGLLRTLIGG